MEIESENVLRFWPRILDSKRGPYASLSSEDEEFEECYSFSSS